MAIPILLASILLGSLAQFCLKKGMILIGGVTILDLVRTPGRFLFMPWLHLGALLYAASLALWLVVLSRIELSRAYPMVSLGYLATFALGVLFFQETTDPAKIAGLLLIMAGVALLARG